MYSGEQEEIDLSEVLYPTGNVEDWLLEVERVMRCSLKTIIGESLVNYPEVSCKLYMHNVCKCTCNLHVVEAPVLWYM